jgi:lipoprotein signal peptidase
MIYMLLVFAVLVLHFIFHSWHVLGRSYSIFYLDEEVTLATMLTSTLAIVTAVAFFEFAYRVKKDRLKSVTSYLAGFFFLALAADEYFSIHEYLNTAIRNDGESLGAIQGVAETSWVFSLGIIILIVILGFLYYIWNEKDSEVQKSYRIGLLFFIFVIVMEPVGGYFFGEWFYLFLVGAEEVSEMLGICFFMNGIYLKSKIKSS